MRPRRGAGGHRAGLAARRWSGRGRAHADRASARGRPSGRGRRRLLARPERPGSTLAGAVNALAAAARFFHLTLARAAPERPVLASTGTGIDYLALVAETHRRSLLHRLRLADPGGAVTHASPWQTINVITGGQLLTTSPG